LTGPTLAPPGGLGERGRCTASGRLAGVVSESLLFGDEALGQTLALLATFIGIGILVNVVIFYIVAQVLVERRQNQQRRASQ